jgi:hypoxanthine phosphoribosyltransferase
MQKQYLSHHSLYVDSYRLGRMILDSSFKPNFILALWRGGCTVGMILQEYLEYHNIPTQHAAVKTSAYQKPRQLSSEVEIKGLESILTSLNIHSKLLVVDDVFDTGNTMKALIQKLTEASPSKSRILKENIQIATLYYKPTQNQTLLKPHFYIHTTEDWLVFPHELEGLSSEEIRKNKDPSILSFF